MNLTRYVETLREQLLAAADSGGPESRAVVERLAPGLEAATRLVLLEALSAAADEITRDLAPGAVEVRLRGSDPDFVVTPPQPADAASVGGGSPTVIPTGDGRRHLAAQPPDSERAEGKDRGGGGARGPLAQRLAGPRRGQRGGRHPGTDFTTQPNG